ncbi:hypothetical protein LXL04_007179 [Taraxacum kok-saghyz]
MLRFSSLGVRQPNHRSLLLSMSPILCSRDRDCSKGESDHERKNNAERKLPRRWQEVTGGWSSSKVCTNQATQIPHIAVATQPSILVFTFIFVVLMGSLQLTATPGSYVYISTEIPEAIPMVAQ